MKLPLNKFRKVIERALEEIPQPLADHLQHVIVDIEPMPDEDTCRSLGLDDPGELMGLYHGTPMTQRDADHAEGLPDRIVIYQRNIERYAESEREVIDEIRTTVLHEVGHHFGLSEEDLDRLGYG